MIHLTLTWRSVVLDMDTKVDILLPENRHKIEDLRGKKHPVLYVLHGMKNDNSSWMNLSNIFLMCRDLDLIVVMPTVYRSFYNDMVYGQDYYTYINEELPQKLANYFPISEKQKDTFIMGESMGGYGTLRIALANPGRFSKAVCLSGGNFPRFFFDFNEKLPKGIFGSQKQMMESDGNLENLIPKFKKFKGKKPEIIFYCGTEDMVYKETKRFYESLRKECPKDKIRGEFWEGEHNYFFWNEAIPKALKEFGFKVPTHSQTI